MRLAIEARRRQAAAVHVVEVVTPRTNVAALTAAENLFAAVSLAEPCSLELAADRACRRFLVRTQGESMRRHLESQLAAAYPQATVRPVPTDADPARVRPDERVAACVLSLRAPAYLPIRTFSDLDLNAAQSAQVDPLLGVLAALGDLPTGWRGLSQLVLRPAAEDWCRGYLRYAVQHPFEHERVPRPTAAHLSEVGLLALVLGLVLLGLQAATWYATGAWLPLAGLGLGIPLGLLGWMKLTGLLRPPVYDMQLVRDKVSRIAYHAELRLAVYAPQAASSERSVRAQLMRIAAAYRHYNLAAGNGLRARPLRVGERDVRQPVPLAGRRARSILTTRELAGLWHLPHAADDVPLVERTGARRWPPLPDRVATGCRIGTSSHAGNDISVCIPDDVLRRHLLLVAKTRRGKSSLMLGLARHTMLDPARRGVLLVDPHRDLALNTLGNVPASRQADVVFVEVAETDRPVGLNVLDAGLGWSCDRAVANTLSVFQREWGDQFWGPRMEDVFRFTLLSLAEANAALCAADPVSGRAAQYTLLDVPRTLLDPRFRAAVLEQVADPRLHEWWTSYFAPLDRRFRDEIANPVLSKINKIQGISAARAILGQPASSIDPAAWVRDGAVVLVDTGRGLVGDSAAGLIGGTLLNLVSLAIAEQVRLEAAQRRSMAIFVDEFHTIPGADYEGILAELSKYGASLVLATQSLERLLSLGSDTKDGHGLRSTVFANLDGLFAFNCSAEDATYLVPELGGALAEQDLLELGEHECYVRLSGGGHHLPAFWVRLDPPPPSDPVLRATLAAASAARYGRPASLAGPRPQPSPAGPAPTPEPEPVPTLPSLAQPAPAKRNQHRRRKRPPQPTVEASAASEASRA